MTLSSSITDRALSTYSATLRVLSSPIEYYIDAKGRKVRKPNDARHVTVDEIRECLLNNRVVEEDDVLEAVGVNVFKTLVKTGKLRKDAKGPFYWVTASCAEAYKLPRVMGCAFPA